MLGSLSLTFSPLVPLWLLAGAAVLSLVLLAFGLLARASGLALRALVLATLLLALANPAAVREQRETREDVALVVTDRSPSQTRIDPRSAQTDQALAQLDDHLERLENTQVRRLESRGQGVLAVLRAHGCSGIFPPACRISGASVSPPSS
ncbi:hypothetical protein [Fodinicurvata halophila]|uniref:hypothetical protein n=1 Tax=Fodinicurvata halophila TaxID=1419723 RepID=UPI0036370980